MPRLFVRASLMATLLFSAACTQQAAQIDLKGQNNYSRNGETASYASNGANSYHAPQGAYQPAPVYSNSPPQPSRAISQSTEQNASIQSIGVSDLAPPSAKAESKPQAASVNPWTNKPRDAGASSDQSFNLQPQGKTSGGTQMVSEVKDAPPQDKSIAQLDSVKPVAKPAAKAVASSGFMWPVNSKKVLSGFGPQGGGKANDGIAIASAEGEPVWAAADGEVVYVGNELKGYGNMVLIKHAGDKTTSYAHLSRPAVDKYDHVKQGDIIGYVGSTGNVKDPQLFFAINEGKQPVDPEKYLNRSVAGLN